MEQFLNILSNLDVRCLEDSLLQSGSHIPTAVFQIVGRDANKILVQVDRNSHFQFAAFYKHKNQLYQHPYTLRTKFNPLAKKPHHQMMYEVLLYLELKRLEDFETDDLKRYYDSIDQKVDSNEELHDFHDVYLMLHYEINGQSNQFRCNNHSPMRLPQFISNSWTSTNTLTRFRYDAENRDGAFPCEMKLCYANLTHSQSYKIVLCLLSNTIPARMDYHALRWLCRLKPKASRQNGISAGKAEKEKSYCLNHASGIVIAQVPYLLNPSNDLNYVQSYIEPEGFRDDLHNSANKDNSTLAIAVIKGTDYPVHMKSRRKDPNFRRYLPFNELENVNNNLETTDGKIIKLLKDHKERHNKQLILFDGNETGTYSQAHIRLYVAAYDENDVLLTEALHPPLRNSKTFEQLRIIRIVQPKHELHANEPAYVYCEFDYSKSRSEIGVCPYKFELVFTCSMNAPNENELLRLFDKPTLSIPASFVPNCECLLQFQVPNDPRYDKHRTFIRLRHRQSKDYNPSAIALCDDECWIYHAEATLVVDMALRNDFNKPSSFLSSTDYDFFHSKESDLSSADQMIVLELHPVNLSSATPEISYESDDSSPFDRRLNTPDFELSSTPRFTFP